jgi:hypothetical protein
VEEFAEKRFGQILKVFAKGLASEADEAAIGEFR